MNSDFLNNLAKAMYIRRLIGDLDPTVERSKHRQAKPAGWHKKLRASRKRQRQARKEARRRDK